MFKMAEIKFKLISGIDQLLFIEKVMRGGVSYIAKRYAKANNKCMVNFNENETSSYVSYLNANNHPIRLLSAH